MNNRYYPALSKILINNPDARDEVVFSELCKFYSEEDYKSQNYFLNTELEEKHSFNLVAEYYSKIKLTNFSSHDFFSYLNCSLINFDNSSLFAQLLNAFLTCCPKPKAQLNESILQQLAFQPYCPFGNQEAHAQQTLSALPDSVNAINAIDSNLENALLFTNQFSLSNNDIEHCVAKLIENYKISIKDERYYDLIDLNKTEDFAKVFCKYLDILPSSSQTIMLFELIKHCHEGSLAANILFLYHSSRLDFTKPSRAEIYKSGVLAYFKNYIKQNNNEKDDFPTNNSQLKKLNVQVATQCMVEIGEQLDCNNLHDFAQFCDLAGWLELDGSDSRFKKIITEKVYPSLLAYLSEQGPATFEKLSTVLIRFFGCLISLNVDTIPIMVQHIRYSRSKSINRKFDAIYRVSYYLRESKKAGIHYPLNLQLVLADELYHATNVSYGILDCFDHSILKHLANKFVNENLFLLNHASLRGLISLSAFTTNQLETFFQGYLDKTTAESFYPSTFEFFQVCSNEVKDIFLTKLVNQLIDTTNPNVFMNTSKILAITIWNYPKERRLDTLAVLIDRISKVNFKMECLEDSLEACNVIVRSTRVDATTQKEIMNLVYGLLLKNADIFYRKNVLLLILLNVTKHEPDSDLYFQAVKQFLQTTIEACVSLEGHSINTDAMSFLYYSFPFSEVRDAWLPEIFTALLQLLDLNPVKYNDKTLYSNFRFTEYTSEIIRNTIWPKIVKFYKNPSDIFTQIPEACLESFAQKFHPDHFGGLIQLKNRLPVLSLFMPHFPEDIKNKYIDVLKDLAEAKDLRNTKAEEFIALIAESIADFAPSLIPYNEGINNMLETLFTKVISITEVKDHNASKIFENFTDLFVKLSQTNNTDYFANLLPVILNVLQSKSINDFTLKNLIINVIDAMPDNKKTYFTFGHLMQAYQQETNKNSSHAKSLKYIINNLGMKRSMKEEVSVYSPLPPVLSEIVTSYVLRY